MSKIVSLLILISVWIDATGQSHIFPPTLLGDYPIGFKSLLFERTLNSGEIRQLNTWIFYPSKKVERKNQKTYLSDERLLAAMKEGKYLGFSDDMLDSWTKIKTNSFEDALPVKKKFPAVFILHGRGSSKINYTLLAEEICSHGYIVVVSDHPGSGLTILKDGTQVTLNTPSDLNSEVKDISDDVCFLVEELPKKEFFSLLIDIKNLGMIGHSLGSMAVFNIALDNCGFKTAINFDGYPFGDVVTKGVSIPHLTLWGESPTWLTVTADTLNARRYKIWKDFAKVSDKDFLVVKERGMYHTDFNDLIFFRTQIQQSRYSNAINPQRGYSITSGITVAYLNYCLKNGKKKTVLNKIKNIPELNIEMDSDEY